MKRNHLLVVDRNPYIRDFLRRELAAEGYSVNVVANGRQIMSWIKDRHPIDLLVLDPDLTDTEGIDLFYNLSIHAPNLPIVVHTLPSENQRYSAHPEIVVCIEKRGNSIELLKEVISGIFQRSKS